MPDAPPFAEREHESTEERARDGIRGDNDLALRMLESMERQSETASTERKHQTKAFTEAMDRQTTQIVGALNTGFTESRKDNRETARTNLQITLAIVGVVLLAMIMLGSIAGAVVWFRGTGTINGSPVGFEVSTNGGAPPLPAVVPMAVPVRVMDTDGPAQDEP